MTQQSFDENSNWGDNFQEDYKWMDDEEDYNAFAEAMAEYDTVTEEYRNKLAAKANRPEFITKPYHPGFTIAAEEVHAEEWQEFIEGGVVMSKKTVQAPVPPCH